MEINKQGTTNFEDIIQVVVGASALSVPVAFSEEAWNLGRPLPVANIIVLVVLGEKDRMRTNHAPAKRLFSLAPCQFLPTAGGFTLFPPKTQGEKPHAPLRHPTTASYLYLPSIQWRMNLEPGPM